MTRYLAFSLCLIGAGCAPQMSEPQAVTRASAEGQADEGCDAFLRAIAQNCFQRTAFLDDHDTPRHVFDAAGHDLGEVDQKWASEYCSCFAQIAYQKFGCETILQHESLSDDEFLKSYEEVIHLCTTSTPASKS